MAHKISDDVAEVLRAATCSSDRLTLVGQLDRKMYEKVNKVLEISGFKWNRKEKCHLAIKGTAAETLAAALADGEIVDPKKDWDFFQTPQWLAERMAVLLNVSRGMRVLEPSAGHGRLLDAVEPLCGKEFVVCCEAFDDCVKALQKRGTYIIMALDFMTLTSEYKYSQGLAGTKIIGRFDRVIANPPFSNFQDITHCRHAYDFLKPGGRMVCITGPSWQFRTDKKSVAFKEWFKSLPSATVEELPAGTFKDSGTNVRALLLVIDKEIE